MPKGICYNASRQERRKCSLWHAKSPGGRNSGAFLFRCGKVAYSLGWLPPIYLRPAICRCSRRLHLPRQRVRKTKIYSWWHTPFLYLYRGGTGITYWLDGGWGVDILAGKQTRIHRDIDINFDAQHTEKLLNVLLNLGYKIDTDWKPVRIELYSDELGYLDIHPFVLNEDGTSKQADLEGGWYEFEKDYFGSVFFEGKTIPCISLKGQKVFHSGYELRDKDKHDISILESLSK